MKDGICLEVTISSFDWLIGCLMWFVIFFHIYFHTIPMKLLNTKNLQTFAKFFSSIPVRFTEGEPLRNHFPTRWDKHQPRLKQLGSAINTSTIPRRGKSSLHCSGIYGLSKTWFFNIFFQTAWSQIRIPSEFPICISPGILRPWFDPPRYPIRRSGWHSAPRAGAMKT